MSSQPIVAPDTTLLNYIQDNWALTDEGITKNDVIFTDKDENTENNTYAPHVIVMPAGSQRPQQEIDDLYLMTFMVKVKLWNRWHKIPKDDDKKYLHWLMVRHVKLMFNVSTQKCPVNWEYAYVSETANTALALDLLPSINEFVLTIKALVPWV
jgi:hypothetical protein